MKKLVLPVLSIFVLLSCGSEPKEKETEEIKEVEETIIEEKVVTVADFILGKWNQIGQDCNEKGENCKPITNANWNFTKDSVTWSKFTLDYKVSNDTILISGSPYVIASELKDTIIFHAIKTKRFMKLVKIKS